MMMKIDYSKKFIKQLRKSPHKIKIAVAQRIALFSDNFNDRILRNHQLTGKYKGYRSIDITGDWRALYKEIRNGNEVTIYFFAFLATHSQLYK